MTYSASLAALKHAGQLITTRIQGLDVLHINLAYFDKQRFSKLSCSDTLPCTKKKEVCIWTSDQNLMRGVIRCNRLKPQEVSETMLFRLVFIDNLLYGTLVTSYLISMSSTAKTGSSLTCNWKTGKQLYLTWVELAYITVKAKYCLYRI